MTITVNRAALARALDAAAGVADPRSTLPILAGVALVAAGGELIVKATDLNVDLATGVKTGGGKLTAVVDARDLAKLVARLPGDDVSLTLDGKSSLVVTSGRSTHKLALLDPAAWPKATEPAATTMIVAAAALLEALAACAPAVCKDESRFHLNGIAIQGRRFIATDGHRMHVAEAMDLGLGRSIIVPASGVRAMMRLLAGAETAEIGEEDGRLTVVAGEVVIGLKLIAAEFPPWQQVMPAVDAATRTCLVDREELIAAVKRAELASSETSGIRLEFDDVSALVIRSSNKDGRDSVETMDATITEGEALVVVNPRYLVEALEMVGDVDQVALRFRSPLDPVVVTAADHDGCLNAHGRGAVIMPVRS